MTRAALTPEAQTQLLEQVRQKLAVTQGDLARRCQVHPRTFSDWMRGKSRIKYELLQRLITHAQLGIDQDIGQLPEFHHVRAAARLGGIRRAALYGNPGTPEGRRRGGMAVLAKRQALGWANGVPDGFKLAKTIKQPAPSATLAEFIGMLLGDGCLSSAFQTAFYFNRETDAAYATFATQLADELFGICPRRWDDPTSKGSALLFSSVRMVNYLVQLGFGRGDKVKQQAGVPPWILEQRVYRWSCLRGLMDTDGSVYQYRHTVSGKQYTHHALCFTNRSHPLLAFVKETLLDEGYHPVQTGFRVYLNRQREVAKYFADIGSHNTKHVERYRAYTRRMA